RRNFRSHPIDLIIEISSRLPAKSIARFHCMSKLWGSIFTFTQDEPLISCRYASGFIYFSHMSISNHDDNPVPVIFNAKTGQYAILPKLRTYISNKFKVLFMDGHPICDVLTLGTGIMRWRKIQCPIHHDPYTQEICINGVLYYLAVQIHEMSSLIVCFDVRSEKFNFIEYTISLCGWSTKLVNYKGKLGVVRCRISVRSLELCIWVLEDIEIRELPKYVYILPVNVVSNHHDLYIVGVTTTCEIVLSRTHTYHTSQPFYVFYFIPESNTQQTVEIYGLDNYSRVCTFVDHVEDLNVNDAKLFKKTEREMKETVGKMKKEEEEATKR
ncbi:hypothetical protein EUTSA_v10012302mg, partial [Eutrema salsugineum]